MKGGDFRPKQLVKVTASSQYRRRMKFSSIAQIGEVLQAPQVGERVLREVWERRCPVEKTVVAKGGAGPGEVPLDWLRGDAEWIRRFAGHALAAQEYLLVCDAAVEGLRLEAGAVRVAERRAFAGLRCDYAAALARLGSGNRAQAELETVLGTERAEVLDAPMRAEVQTLLGHVRSDAAREERTEAEQEAGCVAALTAYGDALALQAGSLEVLSQSAILRLHLRQAAAARAGAEEILRLTENGGAAGEPAGRVLTARAAALAVLGRIGEAHALFQKLKDVSLATTRELAEARHRARFLARACRLPEAAFDGCFPPLRLVVFAGHLPDAPGRGAARFPNTPEAAEAARAALAARLEKLQARVGFASAAAGADLLFLEELLRRGGAAHVVLPWSREQFIAESVRPYGAVWVEKFHAVLGQAASVRELGETYRPSDPIGLEYQTEVTAGLARIIARAARLDVQPVALWDGGAGLPGGTGAFVAFWQDELKAEVEVIAPPATDASGPRLAAERRAHRVEEPIVRQHVKTMLFADIVGYSKLREQLIPDFVREFMGRVAEVMAASADSPMSVNTWGDALYFVFDTAAGGGRFALALQRMIAEQTEHWQRSGLGWQDGPVLRTPTLRIGVHAGPVYMNFDPVVRHLSFTGAHVSRAARIEPVAEVGGVFVSEEFAALAAVSGAGGFACEFAGTMPLAKGFPGRHRIYRLVPPRTLPLDRLARAAHRSYVQTMRARGQSAAALPAMRAWEELPENFRAANFAQAADIENKLRALGYELTETSGLRPADIEITGGQLEKLARAEHQRWMEERLSQGWTQAPVRDDTLRRHPLLVPWEQLGESEREKDRDAIRNLPQLVAEAQYRVRRIARPEP